MINRYATNPWTFTCNTKYFVILLFANRTKKNKATSNFCDSKLLTMPLKIEQLQF